MTKKKIDIDTKAKLLAGAIGTAVAIGIASEVLNLIKYEAELTWYQKLWKKIKREWRLFLYNIKNGR